MRQASRSMASRTIICSSVKLWALIRPGIKEGQRGKIHCCVPHPLERGIQGYNRGYRPSEGHLYRTTYLTIIDPRCHHSTKSANIKEIGTHLTTGSIHVFPF